MPEKKPKFVSPVDVEIKARRAQARLLRKYQPLADKLTKAAEKLGGKCYVGAWFGSVTLYADGKVSRMGEIAPLLRLLAKAGGRKPQVTDNAEAGYRTWKAELEGGLRVEIAAHLKAGGRCRVVVDREIEVEVPAQEARTEIRKTYKIVCS